MSSIPTVVEKRVQLSVEGANRLNRLAQIHQVDEDQIIMCSPATGPDKRVPAGSPTGTLVLCETRSPEMHSPCM